MIDDLFWPEKQTTPPEKLEAKVAALTQALTILKKKIAACSDLYMPKVDDEDFLRYLRLCKYDQDIGVEIVKQVYSRRDTDMYITKLAPSKLVVDLQGKSNEYWPEIWTTPPDEIDVKLALIQRELRLLKENIAREPKLFIPIDDDTFLLRFLRSRKYDHKRTFALIQNYFRIRAANPELFQNFLPSIVWKTILELGANSLSPYLDPQGRVIAIMQAGKWNPATVSSAECFRAFVMVCETASFQPLVQTLGVVGILDLKGLKLMHLLKYSPYLLLTLVDTLLRSFPMKIKGINVVNNPAIVTALYNMIRPFLGQKIQSRIHFHGTKMESLHKQIPPEYLPADYGGHLEAATTDGEVELTLQEENMFRDLQRYGYTS